ncbi:hypothetical protein NC651_000881 [Populus alba x Populus x berolinensis]|nr:hypothetical protein NC651_000881 [Populus alba x Populus x berolinensis]
MGKLRFFVLGGSFREREWCGGGTCRMWPRFQNSTVDIHLPQSNAFDVGNPYGEFKAPYALIYRNMAILGVDGFSALPQHCLQLCYGFFALP